MTTPIRLSINALGGQGGGVLADWIVSLAEAEGWIAQATSVPVLHNGPARQSIISSSAQPIPPGGSRYRH